MCSTADGGYNKITWKSEVLGVPLMDALGKMTSGKLVRSDQVKVQRSDANGAPYGPAFRTPAGEPFAVHQF